MRLDMRKCEKLFTDEFLHWLGPNPALVDKNGIPVPCYRVEHAAHVGTSNTGGLVCYGISPSTAIGYAPEAGKPRALHNVMYGERGAPGIAHYGRGSRRNHEQLQNMHNMERRHVFGSSILRDQDFRDLARIQGLRGTYAGPDQVMCTSFVFLRAVKTLRVGAMIVRNEKTKKLRFTSNPSENEYEILRTGFFARSAAGSAIVRRAGYDSLLFPASGDFVVAAHSDVGSYPVYQALLPGTRIRCADLDHTMHNILSTSRPTSAPGKHNDDVEDVEDEEDEE